MKKFYLLALASLVLFACKEKKTSLKGDEAVEAAEFVEFFPEVSLPFQVQDTMLKKKESDSLLIANTVFTQFIPDSVLVKDFGKNEPKLYALGRAQEDGREVYLFAKAVHGNKRVAYLICFDDENAYLNSMPLIRQGFSNYRNAFGLLDRKYQITTYRERLVDKETSFKRNVYFYNNASNEFSLILTEPNEEVFENIYNPIDTLPGTKPLAGNYVRDDRNFISFRDGRNESELLFFVHFEKDDGECVGEIKGTARMVSEDVAQYHEAGNPCTLEFKFSKNKVEMNEVEGCGSYRDIKCFFDGTFTRKAVKDTSGTRTRK